MKRKKELYEEMKKIQRELKSLNSIVEDENYLPSEDEIHGWAIRMNACITSLEKVKDEVLEFYTS